MIEGVQIHPLRRIPDERGTILHMLRNDAQHFDKFGEIYFSTVYPGVIKGWHLHTEMTLNYSVISGMIKVVLYDDRENSPTQGEIQEIFLGEDNYNLVIIPPFIWNGFKGMGTSKAIVANCATIPHDPQEIQRRDPFDPTIPYDWSLKHR
ncbi:dTDP-4-dehydrorhamnose 3,5-epimerase family protein [Spirulina sp. CS-785/01]|uniref:dTDP-4-dehydrorhamnose 3,5-epimerase family protein n=1 Tax=Spirulina sp. CS-785/01 TaxID=3021716 RepID=UPI00232E5D08|nr:dTDP-4-dehydrorhamnose 3,5-epimerase family protein [Spirulina sp. CS-785/01]MDB9315250.1 dTDP-4-dehydrorhamnose 3,5-epimerase family protein [Spirulina sp. CS-785/01]